MSEVTVKYNGNLIDPAPLIIGDETNNVYNENGDIIGCNARITLRGYVLPATGGFQAVMDDRATILSIFSCPGSLLIECDSDVVLEKCANVISVNFRESLNNLVLSVDYEVVLEITNYDLCCSYALQSRQNRWSVQPDESCNYFSIPNVTGPTRALIISHDVAATAKRQCIDSGTFLEGWEVAKEAVIEIMGFDSGILDTGILGLGCLGDYKLYNHVRKIDIDKDGGSYSLNESWVLIQDTGDLSFAKEEFTVECSESRESRLKSVTLNGSIEGYEESTYDSGCYTISKNKYDSAFEYYQAVTGEFYERASSICGWSLSAVPVSSTTSHSPKLGRISYSRAYDTMSSCFTGECIILKEKIENDITHPADIYGEHNILGRTCPLLQPLGMRTKGSHSVSINLTVDCGDPCEDPTILFVSPLKDQADDILNSLYEYLTGVHDVVVIDGSGETWDSYTGTYLRRITYSYSDCCTGE